MCQGRSAPDTFSCLSFIALIPGRLLSSRACFRLSAMCEVAAIRSVRGDCSYLVRLVVPDHSTDAMHELVAHGIDH